MKIVLRQRRVAIIENLSGRRASCLKGKDDSRTTWVLYVNLYPHSFKPELPRVSYPAQKEGKGHAFPFRVVEGWVNERIIGTCDGWSGEETSLVKLGMAVGGNEHNLSSTPLAR